MNKIVILDMGVELFKKEKIEANKPIEINQNLLSEKFRKLMVESNIERFNGSLDEDYQIYGDDFKISLTVASNDSLLMDIQDFDENHDMESEINFEFSLDELKTFIDVLNELHDKMWNLTNLIK